jgi:hypothetical protein
VLDATIGRALAQVGNDNCCVQKYRLPKPRKRLEKSFKIGLDIVWDSDTIVK